MEEKDAASTADLADIMTDPVNRFYRYPAARALYPVIGGLPLTPNQVTYLHCAIGVLAAVIVAQDVRYGLVTAFVLTEIRLILDCYDGVLARAKKMSSPYGRTLDALADGVAYLALCAAIYVRVHREHPDYPIAIAVLGMIAVGALMAWVSDFYKRKFAAALKDGTDSVYEELRMKLERVRAGEAGFVVRFGVWFDWMQVVILASSSRQELAARLQIGLPTSDPEPHAFSSDNEVQYIVRNAHSKSMRVALRIVSVMSGDNAVTLLNIGLLIGALFETLLFVMLYGLFSMGIGIIICNQFLHGRRAGDQFVASRKSS